MEQKNFKQMTLKELTTELNNYRFNLEHQGYPITEAQKRRWKALLKEFKQKNAELAK